jgi:AraC-like DNA-binding protein
LKKRDTVLAGASARERRPKRTVLDPRSLAERCRQSQIPVAIDLAPFVSVAWTLQWDLGEAAYLQRVLPDPCVQIVVEPDGVHVMGVVMGAFAVTLTGKRFVLGMKFRPGGFRPYLREPISTLTDRTVPLSKIFPDANEPLLMKLAVEADGLAIMQILEALLSGAAPAADVQLQQVHLITDRMAADSTMLSVEHAARVFGLSNRSLQRLFKTYVGVGPKWMLRRYRIQEAAARLETGDVVTWSELALGLGYADQSHFINDFRRLVGRSPASYAKAIERQGALERGPYASPPNCAVRSPG